MPFCVACGAEHPAAARFCPACGRPIAGGPAAAPSASTRKVVTVLFADIVGSTSLGEHHDAETVQALLGEYFERAAGVIRRHGGTVEKFIGDAVVAVFGVPEAHEDDAVRAVRSAVEFRDAVRDLGAGDAAAVGQLQVRVGLTTGEVVVGDPSTGQTFSVGDAMNTAARLQQNAGVDQILIDDLTYDLVGDAVTVEFAGALALKGKQESVRAWAVSSVAAGRTGRRRRLDAPLVGRRAELAELQRALSVVASTGQARMVTLLAEAGVGKSKLAQDFVAGTGVRGLHGRCLSYGEGVTFWPLIEVLRGAAGATDDTPAGVAPGIRALLAGDGAAEQIVERVLEIVSGAGVSNTQELFWALRRFLEAVAASGPTVLVVDDIHWAEPTFLDLLEYLALWTHAPLLLICTARPDLMESRPAWADATNADVLELSALGGDHVEQLVTALLGDAPLEAGAVRRIVAASEGNPLYVEEMVRMLADDAGAVSAENVRVPPTVQALIAARLDRLDAVPQSTLQQASVVGTEFSISALHALVEDRSRTDTPGALRVLVHREFVTPQPAAGDGEYRFAHGLIRDVVYAATPKRHRATLHGRLAAWLQERAVADDAVQYDEIVGHHLGQAASLRMELELIDDQTLSLAAQACELLAAAGRRALARSDLPAATKLLRRAASLSDHDQQTAQLQLELGDALIEMGELDDVAQLLPELRGLAGSDERLRARVDVLQAMLDMNLDVDIDREEIVRRFDAVVEVLSAAGDYVGCAQAHQVLADVNWNDSRFEAAQKDLETALRFAEQAPDARERGRIVTWLASALLWGPAHASDAIQRCEQIVDSAGGDLLVEGKTLLILAGLYAFQGRFDEARRTFARSRQIVEELGLSLTLASGTQVSGMIEMLAGDPVAAEAEFRRGYDALVAMGQKGFLPAAAAFLASALLAQQRYEDAAGIAAELHATAAEDDDAAQGDYARIASRLAAANGDAGAAVQFAEAAVAAYAGTDEIKSHADALHDLAEALVAAGDVDRARSAADQARRLYEMKGIIPSARAVAALLAADGGQSRQSAH